MNITAKDLKDLLEHVPDTAPVVVLEGDDDHDHKKTQLSPYISSDGEVVIQFWN